jgi:hypothetical protein
MADNYLERQMEQYEARKKAWEKSKKMQPKRKTAPRVDDKKNAAGDGRQS